MRVLITGVSGFVGRHLVDLCGRTGAEVVGLGRDPLDPALRARLGSFSMTDLTDAQATAKAVRESRAERIFHLAAEASVGDSWRDPGPTIERNVTSSLNLLEAVRNEAPGARVLISGSGEAYGPVPAERLPVSEEEALRPQNPYAVSKAAVDLLGGFYTDAHGLSIVRTRAFNHCGPGQDDRFVASAFARQIAAAEAAGGASVTLETGNLEPRRDFTDVRDVVRAYWMLLDQPAPGIYNVCSGVSRAIGDVLAGLASHSKLEVRREPAERLIRRHEVMEIYGTHDKLTEATGWQPEIPFADTLRDTLDWWRARTTREVA